MREGESESELNENNGFISCNIAMGERERKRDDCFVFDVDILMAKMPNTKLNDKAFR